jgi:hypothetical protein
MADVVCCSVRAPLFRFTSLSGSILIVCSVDASDLFSLLESFFS